MMKADILEAIAVCRDTENRHFIKFADLLENHLDGIITYAKYHVTTGKVEGTNNLIKTIRRQAYGFHDDDYFFLKIKDASRQKKRNAC